MLSFIIFIEMHHGLLTSSTPLLERAELVTRVLQRRERIARCELLFAHFIRSSLKMKVSL